MVVDNKHTVADNLNIVQLGLGQPGDSVSACQSLCVASPGCIGVYYHPTHGCGRYFGANSHAEEGDNHGVQFYMLNRQDSAFDYSLKTDLRIDVSAKCSADLWRFDTRDGSWSSYPTDGPVRWVGPSARCGALAATTAPNGPTVLVGGWSGASYGECELTQWPQGCALMPAGWPTTDPLAARSLPRKQEVEEEACAFETFDGLGKASNSGPNSGSKPGGADAAGEQGVTMPPRRMAAACEPASEVWSWSTRPV